MKIPSSRFQCPSPYNQTMRGAILCLVLSVLGSATAAQSPSAKNPAAFVDLSLSVSPDYPVTWPSGWPFFQINPYLRLGPLSAYNSEILTIDGNTGTQLDFPPHSIPPPEADLPNAGPLGLVYSDTVPPWQFVGEACVIDASQFLDKGPNGKSSLIPKDLIVQWEKQHRPLGFGDVVLFRSGYTDRYYRPFPAGRRFVAEPVEGKSPGWPDPEPQALDYVGSRGVKSAGTDSPSMGPIPDLAEPTHFAGLKHGMIWTESVTGLGNLPATGAFYCVLAPKHAGGSTSEARAFAIVETALAKQLIDSARNKRVVDLSMTLSDGLPVSWTGSGVGNHRQPYVTVNFLKNPVTGNYQQSHMMDSHTGTHLVPPSYTLPKPGFDNQKHAPEVRKWLAEYEQRYGPRGTSTVTVEKIPISQTCGWVRIISMKQLTGTIDRSSWPASPEIKVSHIKEFERAQGDLKAGEIVIFRTDHSNHCVQSGPEAAKCMESPLNGQAEGWPAPSADTILYLASRGIRCVGTDAPTLGGVNPRAALMTYWALGTKGMVAVEFLHDVEKLHAKAYFLFAPVKIQGTHGGVGRAVALY